MTGARRSPLSRRDARERRQQARIRAVAIGGIALAAGALFGPRVAGRAPDLARAAAFRVEVVSVVGTTLLDPASVAKSAGVARGTPLLDVDPEAVGARLEALPQVAAARVLRLPPNRLVIGIDERLAQGVTEDSRGAWLVCLDGVPFAPAEASQRARLPRLRAPGAPAAGVASPELAQGAAVASAARRSGFAVAEVRVAGAEDPRGALLRLRGLDTEVVLGHEGHQAALARLVAVFARRPAWVAEAATIDVRFSDRAVLGGGAPAERQAQGEDAPTGERKAAVRRGFGGRPEGPAAG